MLSINITGGGSVDCCGAVVGSPAGTKRKREDDRLNEVSFLSRREVRKGLLPLMKAALARC